ncbi:hypothetical protein MTP99_011298 [Tenebrio molitor]|jgi:hypothetical protein|nr:hypothetical protein MTP99_011298 [Tenebrio molitor]
MSDSSLDGVTFSSEENPYYTDDDSEYRPSSDAESSETGSAENPEGLLDEDDTEEDNPQLIQHGHDEEWTDPEQDPEDISFTGIPSINLQLLDETDPIQYLDALFDQHIINIIVEETNRRAQDNQAKIHVTRETKNKPWTSASGTVLPYNRRNVVTRVA